MAGMAHWLGVQIRSNSHKLPGQMVNFWMGSANGQSRWLVSLLRGCSWQEYRLQRSELWLL